MLISSTLTAIAAVRLDTAVWSGLQGTHSGVVVNKFLGLPFAAPAIRFAPPSSPVASTNAQTATERPASCTDKDDCLYLNVFAPAPINGSLADKTVMVFFGCESNNVSAASSELYDGMSFAAEQDVVLVVPNYRTGVLGFPGPLNELPISDRNLGLLDQRMALRWVHDNIAKFAGDASKVTIFGNSEGGSTIGHQILKANVSQPLFRAAIMQSGTTHVQTPPLDLMPGSKTKTAGPSEQLAKELGCTGDVLECLRRTPMARIREGQAKLSLAFTPVEDGGLTFTSNGEQLRKDKKLASIPILLGTDADEAKVETRLRSVSLNDYLQKTFPKFLHHHILMAYQPGLNSSYKTDFDAVSAIETDFHFTCVTSREARVNSEAGYPTWRYLFNASYPHHALTADSGVYHGSEVKYVFGNLPSDCLAEEKLLSQTVQTAWARFAKDPTAGPGWSRVGSNGGLDMGVFEPSGKLRVESPKFTDRWCVHWDMFLSMPKGT